MLIILNVISTLLYTQKETDNVECLWREVKVGVSLSGT